jgi:hypothetical protein
VKSLHAKATDDSSFVVANHKFNCIAAVACGYDLRREPVNRAESFRDRRMFADARRVVPLLASPWLNDTKWWSQHAQILALLDFTVPLAPAIGR